MTGPARYPRRVICVCHGSRYCPDGKSEPARPPDQQLTDDPSEGVVTRFGKAVLREEALSRRVEELEREANTLKDKLAEALKIDRAEYDEIEASVSDRPKEDTPDE